MTVEPNRAHTGKSGRNTVAVPAENMARSQSLYRKWRSQTFSELVGQDAITRTLQNAIAGGRVAHAYLFCGPRGTGKTSSARLLAKALNCTYPDAKKRPCNECEACRAIAEGRAMDLIEIDAASNRGIDEIRSLRDTIGYQPSQFKYKFYIIDEVHMLTEPAFNALLKTLEEPPPHAIFVLATTDPQDIPATVVSRCQRFDFQRIGLEQIAARLAYICGEEGIEAEASALELVARQATGSLRDALSLLDQLIVFSGGVITADTVRSMLGVMNSEATAEFIDCLIEQDMAGGLELINRLVQSGTDLKRFNREIVDYLRALMLVKANPGSGELADMTREAIETIQAQASRLDLGEVIGFLKIFSGVDYNLKVSPYGQLPLEIALMEAVLNRPSVAPALQPRPAATAAPAPTRPAQAPAPALAATRPPQPAPRSSDAPSIPPRPATTIKPVDASPEPETVETIEKVVAKKPEVPVPAPRPMAAQAPAPATARTLRQGLVSEKVKAVSEGEESSEVVMLELASAQAVWTQVVDSIGSHSQMLKALLREARPVATEGNYIVLAFKWDFHRERISQDNDRRIVVEDYYSRTIGQKVLIKCIAEDESAGANGAPNGNASESDKPERQARDDQRRRAAQVFNARILD